MASDGNNFNDFPENQVPYADSVLKKILSVIKSASQATRKLRRWQSLPDVRPSDTSARAAVGRAGHAGSAESTSAGGRSVGR